MPSRSPASAARTCLPLLALLWLGIATFPTSLSAQQEAVVVYLVRHAERAEDGTSDPPISEAGTERARLLGGLLRDAGVTHVHTTDLKRTRQTGAPLAERLGLDFQVYDPKDLPALAARLRATPGRHLVLGHSNTLVPTVEALGGAGGTPVADDEFDRLYVLVITPQGTVTTTLLRYGAPSPP
ncbi:MAG TPA: histidine phosphatase family protein [Longimicrobiales bacterium]|nr:histidine phosphatase family protein [Longimicrobiales bacterium]